MRELSAKLTEGSTTPPSRRVAALLPLHKGGFGAVQILNQFDKLEFGGESPLTMRARCCAFRYCPDPLGIVTAEQFDKLEFDS